jgi:hypothetical protein
VGFSIQSNLLPELLPASDYFDIRFTQVNFIRFTYGGNNRELGLAALGCGQKCPPKIIQTQNLSVDLSLYAYLHHIKIMTIICDAICALYY